jgi:hypothetical protein
MTWIAVGVTGGSALLGYMGSRRQPTQQTQTNAQGGTSGYTNGAMLDPNAQASIQHGLNQSRDMYNSGQGVSPVYGQAQNAVSQGLMGQQKFGGYQGGAGYQGQGGYQARDVNPYANLAFNAAADATQNRLSGEFARSGRNLAAAQPARSQELQHLAAGIYAPAYEAEAQRQYGSQESAAQRMYGAQEAGADRAYGAAEGAAGRGLSAYQGALGASPYFSQTAQNMGLDQYLQRVQGLAPMLPQTQYGNSQSTGNGAQTSPLYNNPMAGAMGGAMLGNQFAGMFGGMLGNRVRPQMGGIADINSGGYIPGT